MSTDHWSLLPVAFWMTLATMLCGYGSGVVRNLRQETLDRHIISHHLPFAIPAALVGGYLAPALNISWLVLLFGLFVLVYGVHMLVHLLLVGILMLVRFAALVVFTR